MTELVSIIIPARDPGDFLREALASVLAQTCADWLCVVVDDGSTEDLSWVGQLDPRVSLHQQSRQGVASARNAGARATTGRFVAFLDADDRWHPRKLELQLAALHGREDAVLCHTGASLIDSRGLRLGPWPYGGPVEGYRELILSPALGVPSVMVRRQALDATGGWDETLRFAEDVDLWLRLIAIGPFVYVDEELFDYRQHASNATRNIRPLVLDTHRVYRRHAEAARRTGDVELVATIEGIVRASGQGWGATAYDHARVHLASRDWAAATRSFADALRLNPRYTSRSAMQYLWRRVGDAR